MQHNATNLKRDLREVASVLIPLDTRLRRLLLLAVCISGLNRFFYVFGSGYDVALCLFTEVHRILRVRGSSHVQLQDSCLTNQEMHTLY
jgi:hypothetical protein